MRKIVLAAAVALTALASPAMAEGFRAELRTGYDDIGGNGERIGGFHYGLGLGYDAAIGSNWELGAELGLDDSTGKECDVTDCARVGRDISILARVGYKASEAGTVYGLVGYTNAALESEALDDTLHLDGLRLGVGYQHMVSGNVYAKAEYRYSDYEADVNRHQLLAGVGIKF